jgi:hypothetical protein
MEGTYQSDLKLLVKAERQVADRVDGLCARLHRVELDEERLSEMYTILQALKHECQFNVAAYDALLDESQQGVAHV